MISSYRLSLTSTPIKILFTTFAFALIILYWPVYGPYNFLWLSDISLFLTVAALWLGPSKNYSSSSNTKFNQTGPLIISIATVGLLPAEIAWNIDLLLHLMTGMDILGMTTYMFNSQLPLYLRLFSLFHIVLPFIWIRLIIQWGYQRSAVWYALVMIWTVFFLSYMVSTPKENINAVYVSIDYGWGISPAIWLVVLMLGYALIFIAPMHLILKRFAKAHRAS